MQPKAQRKLFLRLILFWFFLLYFTWIEFAQEEEIWQSDDFVSENLNLSSN